MKIETISVTGFEGAIMGIRLPMCKNLDEVKGKSDSGYVFDSLTEEYKFVIGEEDKKLAKKLIKADEKESSGQPNSKFLRMIHVQVCVTAPLFWWKEADTYKVGTTANSTSTMHTITKYPITKDCFEEPDLVWTNTINTLEETRQRYLRTKDKEDWKELIENLPESWLQTRMFDLNYETLRNIYQWRCLHKLSQWQQFCDWIKTLPYAFEFICS